MYTFLRPYGERILDGSSDERNAKFPPTLPYFTMLIYIGLPGFSYINTFASLLFPLSLLLPPSTSSFFILFHVIDPI